MQYLLPPVKKYFKASLHTHSTVSDGKLTPQEVAEAYRQAGYSILAMTDHSVMAAHPELDREDFLMLTGAEIDADEDYVRGQPNMGKACHLCIISKVPNRLWIPFADPDMPESQLPYFEKNACAGMERRYDRAVLNKAIAEANRQGFFVTYNHPTWSLESYPDYAPLEGLWGMEYRNTGSINLGYDENNGRVYQDFLMQGKRMVPIMADDMHNPRSTSGAMTLGGSWTMIGAETLTYASVVEAMERGDLYSSCGPEISGLTWDGKKLRITCSPVQKIEVMTQSRVAKYVCAEAGETLTEAEIDMSRWLRFSKDPQKSFLRLILTAPDGTYAVTRAYWLDELE